MTAIAFLKLIYLIFTIISDLYCDFIHPPNILSEIRPQSYVKPKEKALGIARESGAEGENLKLLSDFLLLFAISIPFLTYFPNLLFCLLLPLVLLADGLAKCGDDFVACAFFVSY